MTFDVVHRQNEVVAPPLLLSADKLLELVAAGFALEVAGRDDRDEEPGLIQHLVQLPAPAITEPDAIDVLEDLEGLTGDGAHRTLELLPELADRAAVVLIVEARVAEKCVRRSGWHGRSLSPISTQKYHGYAKMHTQLWWRDISARRLQKSMATPALAGKIVPSAKRSLRSACERQLVAMGRHPATMPSTTAVRRSPAVRAAYVGFPAVSAASP
jgi:hypothetical protein